MLAVEQSLIGKEACELVKSIVTGKPFCKTQRRMGRRFPRVLRQGL